MTELKPCPFCGGEARPQGTTECWGHGCYITSYYIVCGSCGAKGRSFSEYDLPQSQCKLGAITAWNTRASQKEVHND